MKRLALLCLFLAGFGPFICDDADVETARGHLRTGASGKALEALDEVSADAAEVHLARAVALLHDKKADEAIEALSNAYRLVAGADARGEPLPNGEDLRRRIAFNRGLAQVQKEAWEEAIAEFGKVLLIDPEDDVARHNLELAWLKAHPPCPLREDDHEPDDTRKDAKPLAKPEPSPDGQPPQPSDRLLCPADEDWYAIEAPANSLLYVTLTGEVVVEEEGTTREVTLELYAPEDADGKPSRQAEFKDGQARVSYTGLPAAGSWAVRIAGPGKAELKYQLNIELVPPCPADDQLEGQDTIDAPKELAEGEEPTLKACPGNDDWFLVKVPPKEGRRVTVAYDTARAPLDTELLDAERNPVLRAEPGEHGSVVRLPATEAEQVFRVRVAAASADENIYKIKVEKDEGDNKDQDDQKDQEDQKDPPPEDQKGEEPPPQPPPPDQVDLDQLIDSLDQHERNPQLEKALRELKAAPPPMEDY